MPSILGQLFKIQCLTIKYLIEKNNALQTKR
jgi:hypothetical protein